MAPLGRGLVLTTLILLGPCAAGQDGKPVEKADGTDRKVTVAKGEVVTELGESVMYVFQAKGGEYWFGSNDRGVYRFDGKSLVNFTTKDGLVSDRIRGIQEDKAGNVYFTTHEGLSKFDGQSFTTLGAGVRGVPGRGDRAGRVGGRRPAGEAGSAGDPGGAT
jgi:hypothetical protein